MNLHAIGIDLGKTVFHLVGSEPGRRGCGAEEVLAYAASSFHFERRKLI